MAVREQELIDATKTYANSDRNLQIFRRSHASQHAENSMLNLYEWHADLAKQGFTDVVLVNCCCPFLEWPTIKDFIECYEQSDYNGLFAVTQQKNYFWDSQGNLLTEMPESGLMNTKAVDPIYAGAHCLYASSLEELAAGRFMGGLNNLNAYHLEDSLETFDIDYEWQFGFAETYFRHGRS